MVYHDELLTGFLIRHREQMSKGFRRIPEPERYVHSNNQSVVRQVEGWQLPPKRVIASLRRNDGCHADSPLNQPRSRLLGRQVTIRVGVPKHNC